MSLTKKNMLNIGGKTKKRVNNLSGGGLFSSAPKTYTNVKYNKSGYTIPILTCLQCKNNVFRHHKLVTESRLRAFFLDSFWGKKNNAFVCNKCGHIMMYSGDIKYSNKQISTI